eukprot:NODE_5808_length_360_cov_429.710611_g3805_i3.p2 GENE.NODE_5808_length_360_cov_429.710611_g3805_i3~~NODE_5808_length_360_cov_429.710611_g3805_i3.p2  ORF type:complete len:69 (+),score=24.24 NODE_5808_length_360_cov_429.710611_g3805_i3:31-207(+)
MGELEADVADKVTALKLDRRCLELDLDKLSLSSSAAPSSARSGRSGRLPSPRRPNSLR